MKVICVLVFSQLLKTIKLKPPKCERACSLELVRRFIDFGNVLDSQYKGVVY